MILGALCNYFVGIIADREAIRTAAGQHAVVTTALLCARSGAVTELFLPDCELLGPSAPLEAGDLASSLDACLKDLVSYSIDWAKRDELDLLVVIGTPTPLPKSRRVVFLGADDWSGSLGGTPFDCKWGRARTPFGPLAAAGLAAGEAFKDAISGLEHYSIDQELFRQLFSPSSHGRVALAPIGTGLPTSAFGTIDIISAGAITHCFLYSIMRLEGANGMFRVIDRERNDVTNLNRYSLLRRSALDSFKTDSLAELSSLGLMGSLQITPERVRYDHDSSKTLFPLAPRVLLGVDHIPTRWLVQQQWPRWLGVGATSHYLAMASFHTPQHDGCAGCLHPRDDDAQGNIPTAAVVSHWSGLMLAAYFVRGTSQAMIGDHEQVTYCWPMRLPENGAMWRSPIARNLKCPVHRQSATTDGLGFQTPPNHGYP